MQMSCIWISFTYAFFSLFPVRSEKYQFRIFLNPTGAQKRRNTTCGTPSAAFSSIYSVYSLPRDCPLTTGKGRCGYSVCVIHFRKLRNSVKIGSDRNGPPVI